jgi:16S rRNA (cytosine1402-N4)-methyltransferase
MSHPANAPEPTPARHVPVLLNAVLQYLNPQPGETIVDATLGAAGHACMIQQRLGPTGRLIGIDRDSHMIELARQRIGGSNVALCHANFAQLAQTLQSLGVGPVHGVLIDLGIASDQLDDAARGFGFSQAGPLDMRMDANSGSPASRWINQMPADRLADIFYEYGEERYSRRVARAIVAARQQGPIGTTDELAAIVRRALPHRGPRQKIDPATRVFQALRIAVNEELENLDQVLVALPSCLLPGGRAVIISFHSLEDRRVKYAFRNRVLWEVLTRRPVRATPAEIAANPRSRSAKLRAAVRTGDVETQAVAATW